MNLMNVANGTPIRLDERSEHYPGAIVYIVDKLPDPEYPICVAPTMDSPIVHMEWIRLQDIKKVKQGGVWMSAKHIPTRMGRAVWSP